MKWQAPALGYPTLFSLRILKYDARPVMNENHKAARIPRVSKELCAQMVDAITSYKPVDRILLFGSRATGESSPRSDIDIAIFAKNWSRRDFNLVKDLVRERVKTALKIDLLHFNSLEKKKLKDNILNQGKLIYESGAQD